MPFSYTYSSPRIFVLALRLPGELSNLN